LTAVLKDDFQINRPSAKKSPRRSFQTSVNVSQFNPSGAAKEDFEDGFEVIDEKPS